MASLRLPRRPCPSRARLRRKCPFQGGTLDELAGALTLNVQAGRMEAVVALQPPSLGKVRVQLVAGPDGLTIRITADQGSTGAFLRSQLGELRDGLTTRGVSVAELHVLPNQPTVAAPESAGDAPSRHRAAQGSAGGDFDQSDSASGDPGEGNQEHDSSHGCDRRKG